MSNQFSIVGVLQVIADNASIDAAVLKVKNKLKTASVTLDDIKLGGAAADLQKQISDIFNAAGDKQISLDFKVRGTRVQTLQRYATAIAEIGKAATTSTPNVQAFATAVGSITSSLQAFNSAAKNIPRVTINLKNSGEAADGAAKQFNSFGSGVGFVTRRFAEFTLGAGAIIGTLSAIKSGFGEAFSFQDQIVKIGQVTGTSVTSLKNMRDEVGSLSTGLGVSSKDLIEVSKVLAQAGIKGDDLKQSLEGLAKSALAPNFKDLTDTGNALIAAFSQFNKTGKDTENILGAINAVAGEFAVEASDITTAIQKSGGAFKTAGGDLNELIALFTSVRQTTRESADQIATGFRTIFGRLQRKDTIDTLKAIGVELTDAQGKFVGPIQAIATLNKELSALSPRDVRYAQIVEQIGGLRQISRVIPLIQQFNVTQKALGVAIAGQSSISADAARAQESLLVQLTKVKEEFLELFRVVADSKEFRQMISNFLDLAKSAAEVGRALAPVIPLIAQTISAAAVVGAVKAVPSVLGGFNRTTPVRRAMGGPISGDGNTDSVLALLTPGEYVLDADTVRKIGLERLRKLKTNLPRFAKGGLVLKSGAFVASVLAQYLASQSAPGAISSGISGAANAGLAGSVFGGKGAAIAAGIGGTLGAIRGANDNSLGLDASNKELDATVKSIEKNLERFDHGVEAVNRTNFAKAFEEVDKQRNDIISRRTAEFQGRSLSGSGPVNAVLRAANFVASPFGFKPFDTEKEGERFNKDTGRELEAAGAAAANAINQLVLKQATRQTSQQFLQSQAPQDLARAATISTGSPSAAFEVFARNFGKALDTAKLNDTVNKTDQAFAKFRESLIIQARQYEQVSAQLQLATLNLQKFSDTNVSAADVLQGAIPTFRPRQASRELDISSQTDPKAFNSAVDFVLRPFGTELGTLGGDLSQSLKIQNEISDKLPGILEKLANSDIGDGAIFNNLPKEIRAALRLSNPEKPTNTREGDIVEQAINNIKAALDKIAGPTGVQDFNLKEKLKNPTEVIDQIKKLLEPQTKIVNTLAKEQEAAQNEILKLYKKQADLIKRSNEELAKLDQLRDEQLKLEAEQRGKSLGVSGTSQLSTSDLLRGFNTRIQRLTPPGVDRSPQGLTDFIKSGVKQLGELQKRLNESQDLDTKNSLQASIADLSNRLDGANAALREFADITRVATLREKERDLEERRGKKVDLITNLLGANPAELGRLRQQLGSLQAVKQNGINNVPLPVRQAAIEGARQFGDVPLPLLGGKTGNKFLEEQVTSSFPGVFKDEEQGLKEVRASIQGEFSKAVDAQIKITDLFQSSTSAFDKSVREFAEATKRQYEIAQAQASIAQAQQRKAETQKTLETAALVEKSGLLTTPDGKRRSVEELRNLEPSVQSNIRASAKIAEIDNIFKDIKPDFASLGESIRTGDVSKAIPFLSPIAVKSGVVSEQIGKIRDSKEFKEQKFSGSDDAIGRQAFNFIRSALEKDKVTGLSSRDIFAESSKNLPSAFNSLTLEEKKKLQTLNPDDQSPLGISPEVTGVFRDTNRTVGTLMGTITSLDATIKALTTKLEGLQTAQPKAGGGAIYGKSGPALFVPRGTDTVPAMLSPNEYVVNSKSATANRPLLERINKAKGPVYLAKGGPVGIPYFKLLDAYTETYQNSGAPIRLPDKEDYDRLSPAEQQKLFDRINRPVPKDPPKAISGVGETRARGVPVTPKDLDYFPYIKYLKLKERAEFLGIENPELIVTRADYPIEIGARRKLNKQLSAEIFKKIGVEPLPERTTIRAKPEKPIRAIGNAKPEEIALLRKLLAEREGRRDTLLDKQTVETLQKFRDAPVNTTGAPSVGVYRRYFEPLFRAGKDVAAYGPDKFLSYGANERREVIRRLRKLALDLPVPQYIKELAAKTPKFGAEVILAASKIPTDTIYLGEEPGGPLLQLPGEKVVQLTRSGRFVETAARPVIEVSRRRRVVPPPPPAPGAPSVPAQVTPRLPSFGEPKFNPGYPSLNQRLNIVPRPAVIPPRAGVVGKGKVVAAQTGVVSPTPGTIFSKDPVASFLPVPRATAPVVPYPAVIPSRQIVAQGKVPPGVVSPAPGLRFEKTPLESFLPAPVGARPRVPSPSSVLGNLGQLRFPNVPPEFIEAANFDDAEPYVPQPTKIGRVTVKQIPLSAFADDLVTEAPYKAPKPAAPKPNITIVQRPPRQRRLKLPAVVPQPRVQLPAVIPGQVPAPGPISNTPYVPGKPIIPRHTMSLLLQKLPPQQREQAARMLRAGTLSPNVVGRRQTVLPPTPPVITAPSPFAQPPGQPLLTGPVPNPNIKLLEAKPKNDIQLGTTKPFLTTSQGFVQGEPIPSAPNIFLDGLDDFTPKANVVSELARRRALTYENIPSVGKYNPISGDVDARKLPAGFARLISGVGPVSEKAVDKSGALDILGRYGRNSQRVELNPARATLGTLGHETLHPVYETAEKLYGKSSQQVQRIQEIGKKVVEDAIRTGSKQFGDYLKRPTELAVRAFAAYYEGGLDEVDSKTIKQILDNVESAVSDKALLPKAEFVSPNSAASKVLDDLASELDGYVRYTNQKFKPNIDTPEFKAKLAKYDQIENAVKGTKLIEEFGKANTDIAGRHEVAQKIFERLDPNYRRSFLDKYSLRAVKLPQFPKTVATAKAVGKGLASFTGLTDLTEALRPSNASFLARNASFGKFAVKGAGTAATLLDAANVIGGIRSGDTRRAGDAGLNLFGTAVTGAGLYAAGATTGLAGFLAGSADLLGGLAFKGIYGGGSLSLTQTTLDIGRENQAQILQGLDLDKQITTKRADAEKRIAAERRAKFEDDAISGKSVRLDPLVQAAAIGLGRLPTKEETDILYRQRAEKSLQSRVGLPEIVDVEARFRATRPSETIARPDTTAARREGREIALNRIESINEAARRRQEYREETDRLLRRKRFAMGGLVTGRKGRDQIDAALTDGEFVVNEKATRDHLPLLQAMNGGQKVEYHATGGVVGKDKERAAYLKRIEDAKKRAEHRRDEARIHFAETAKVGDEARESIRIKREAVVAKIGTPEQSPARTVSDEEKRALRERARAREDEQRKRVKLTPDQIKSRREDPTNFVPPAPPAKVKAPEPNVNPGRLPARIRITDDSPRVRKPVDKAALEDRRLNPPVITGFEERVPRRKGAQAPPNIVGAPPQTPTPVQAPAPAAPNRPGAPAAPGAAQPAPGAAQAPAFPPELVSSLNAFSKAAGPLTEALAKFTPKIELTIGGTQNVSVTFAGGEFMKELEPTIKKWVTKAIAEKVTAYFQGATGLNDVVNRASTDRGSVA